MGYEKIGEWERVKSLIDALKKEYKSCREETAKSLGEHGVKIARDHLDSGDLPWPPLTENYLAQKIADGYPATTLIRSKLYYDTIKYIWRDDVLFVGIPAGARTNDGDDMTTVAAVHEFGAKGQNIEPRPLWTPTGAEMAEWLGKNNPATKLIERLKQY